MKRLAKLSFLVFMLLGLIDASAYGVEVSGRVAVEGRAFTGKPRYLSQDWGDASFTAEPELYHEWSGGSSFVFTPYVRFDSTDPERTHYDIRELNYLWVNDKFELRLGIGKVFWGVAETQHLVDVINQTDLVDALDGEEKLGQPMVHLSVPREEGVFDIFLLPYFRQRTFPGKKGRLRSSLVVDPDIATYSSPLKEYHPDVAIRYSRTVGLWDIGLSHFWGTNREPTLVPDINDGGVAVWRPHYEIIHQTGLELQLVTDSWLWKYEAIYRSGQSDKNFAAFSGGFEYTFTQKIVTGGMDVGVLLEWLYDTRGRKTTTAYDNDIMFGTRLGLNDAASTEALMGIVQDLDSKGLIFTLESSRRLGESWKISLEAFFVAYSSARDTIYPVRDDDYVQMELSYNF